MTWINFPNALEGTDLYRINLDKVNNISGKKDSSDGQYAIKFYLRDDQCTPVWFKDKPTRDGALRQLDNILGTVKIKAAKNPEVKHDLSQSPGYPKHVSSQELSRMGDHMQGNLDLVLAVGNGVEVKSNEEPRQEFEDPTEIN